MAKRKASGNSGNSRPEKYTRRDKAAKAGSPGQLPVGQNKVPAASQSPQGRDDVESTSGDDDFLRSLTEFLKWYTRDDLPEEEKKEREILQAADKYLEQKLAEHGDKPTPRNPNFWDPEWREEWEGSGFLDPVPWFWNIPDDLPPIKKAQRMMLKEIYWLEALASPEELAEYKRLDREGEKIRARREKEIRELEAKLGIPPEPEEEDDQLEEGGAIGYLCG
ncbi:MAG: hypothetical protein NZ899_15240 [Thermoguttaceae bacterium]|nr:hypothetical protein [Thermoguttaceae bacterium]